MDRRKFLRISALASAGAMLEWQKAFAVGAKDAEAGKTWKGWKKGHFQVHFIYTGVAESMFMIFPDGTTMLLDCGDHDAIGRGKLAVPVLPEASRHAGEWIARYVQRVNPSGNYVDYMMLSHYHSDHGGCGVFSAGDSGNGYLLSGFGQAAEFLEFGTAFDRCWPDCSDPIPLQDDKELTVTQMKRFYEYMSSRRGLKVEKFTEGVRDQVCMKHNPKRFKDFSIWNLCANGRIVSPDGRRINLYEDRLKNPPKKFNENGMSLGMIISYGGFKFYTAGDFSDKWKLSDGTVLYTEEVLADYVVPVDVAKVNHHGHNSMPAALVAALCPRVFVSCVWDQHHNLPKVMERMADRSLYPGERIICPGVFPAERRAEDAGAEWLADVAGASFDAGHMVLDVKPGGREYSLTYLTAADESMTVRSVMRFKK